MACENVARVVKMKIKTEKSDCNILSEIFGNFQFFVEKKNFSPSLQKSPNLKKSKKSLNKNLNPSTKISIYLSCFLPLQPNTVALFQYLPSASLSLAQKSPLSKIQKLSKNINKLSNTNNKNVTILPWFWGFSPSSTQRQPFLATFLGF